MAKNQRAVEAGRKGAATRKANAEAKKAEEALGAVERLKDLAAKPTSDIKGGIKGLGDAVPPKPKAYPGDGPKVQERVAPKVEVEPVAKVQSKIPMEDMAPSGIITAVRSDKYGSWTPQNGMRYHPDAEVAKDALLKDGEGILFRVVGELKR